MVFRNNRLEFSTKARTLNLLRDSDFDAEVLPLIFFTVGEYNSNSNKIIDDILYKWQNQKLVVRSSAISEDNFNSSNAGHYKSILNVNPTREALDSAISQVIDSMAGSSDEVLIQPMLNDVEICGVAFTCNLDTLAPYYIINYDSSGKTDVATSGKDGDYTTYIQYKHYTDCPNLLIKPLINILQSLETLFCNEFLDVEFAIDKAGKIYILQVRPIVKEGKKDYSKLNLSLPLERIYKKIQKLSMPHPNLLGSKAVFGVMPDWNPAEILGLKPRKLALSLYKELITDSIWAYQRDNYGYRNLRSHPLLISFMGVPFVDLRVDFNSFIPKDLPDGIASKLVDFYLNKFILNPSYHDKVEFEIVYSCYFIDLPERLKELEKEFSFSEIEDIKLSLLSLTNNIICDKNGLYKNDLEKINVLNDKYENIVNSQLSIIDKIYWLCEDCKRYGTLPFAGIARAAFIAVQLLNSLVDKKLISSRDKEAFLNSLNTVSRQISIDIKRLSGDEFLSLYGHLRPGTYDILSARYDEEFEKYFGDNMTPMSVSEIEQGKKTELETLFTGTQLKLIDEALEEEGLTLNAVQLFSFIEKAIEGREYSKYIFTKSLSKILSYINELGNHFNIDKEQLSHLDFKKILDLYSNLDNANISNFLQQDINYNKSNYDYTKAINFPDTIISPEDIYSYQVIEDKPNFVSLNSVEGEVVLEKDINSVSLDAKVVFIQSADPGYDFLFTKKIAGLITQFGGANSHMAIRCAELGIPAVIGAGEKYFNQWKKYSKIRIDSEKQIVENLL